MFTQIGLNTKGKFIATHSTTAIRAHGLPSHGHGGALPQLSSILISTILNYIMIIFKLPIIIIYSTIIYSYCLQNFLQALLTLWHFQCVYKVITS